MRRFAPKGHIDELLLMAWGLLVLIGLVMVYSSSSIIAENRFGTQWHFFRQQLLWALMAALAVFAITRLDLKRVAIYAAPGLLMALVLLTAVFVMPARNGSHRWIFLGPFSMQPSELFRFLLMLYLAFSLANPKRDISKVQQLLWPYGAIVMAGLALIILEPDLGMVIMIGLTCLGIFFLAGMRIKHLVLAGAPVVGAASVAVFVFGYKKARVFDFLEAIVDPLNGSYQVKQAALAFGSGGLFGTGLGEGNQKLFFLPYPYTDFIFASTGEELGFIGVMFVVILLFFVLLRGLRIAARQPDRFGYLLAAGTTWSLFVNIAINLGVVTSLIPVTGLPLPFLSYGGSSLLMNSAAVAVLLNLSRRRVEETAHV